MDKVYVEELTQEMIGLRNVYDVLLSETRELQKQKRQLQQQESVKTAVMLKTANRIKAIKDSLVAETVFYEMLIAKVANVHLLCKDEMDEIIKGIDKKDYTKYGCAPIQDLEQVVELILRIKQLHPTWKFHKLCKSGQRDSVPPINFYQYAFMTPENFKFVLGGIEIE